MTHLPVDEDKLGKTRLGILDLEEGVLDLARVKIFSQLNKAIFSSSLKLESICLTVVTKKGPVCVRFGVCYL